MSCFPYSVLILSSGLLYCGVFGTGSEQIAAQNQVFGYQPGEVTQGIGYGHYLHPFYYQGEAQRYYNCAVEDEWNPITKIQEPQPQDDLTPKPQKHQLPKKYDYKQEKSKPYLQPSNRLKLTPRSFSIKPKNSRKGKSTVMQSRNDYGIEGNLKRDHAKLLMEINAMSESRPIPTKYERDESHKSQKSPSHGIQSKDYIRRPLKRTPQRPLQSSPTLSSRPVQPSITLSSRPYIYYAGSPSMTRPQYPVKRPSQSRPLVSYARPTSGRVQVRPASASQGRPTGAASGSHGGRRLPVPGARKPANLFQQLLLLFPNLI